jgi:hypothetical protein
MYEQNNIHISYFLRQADEAVSHRRPSAPSFNCRWLHAQTCTIPRRVHIVKDETTRNTFLSEIFAADGVYELPAVASCHGGVLSRLFALSL